MIYEARGKTQSKVDSSISEAHVSLKNPPPCAGASIALGLLEGTGLARGQASSKGLGGVTRSEAVSMGLGGADSMQLTGAPRGLSTSTSRASVSSQSPASD